MRGAWILTLLMLALPSSNQDAVELQFHHLHLGDDSPGFRISYYERLFDPALTTRVEFAGANGLHAGRRLILVSIRNPAETRPSGLWHFGWGEVSLGDNYLAHARRDVVWEPPLPADALHVHLQSINPRVTVAWFRDILGATVGLAARPRRQDEPLPPPERRFPEALIRLGGIDMDVYPTEGPLFSSLGQAIDHVAFTCENLDDAVMALRRKGVVVTGEPKAVDEGRLAMIEGPDRIAIELVELKQ